MRVTWKPRFAWILDARMRSQPRESLCTKHARTITRLQANQLP